MTAVPYRSAPTPAEARRLEELTAELESRGVLAPGEGLTVQAVPSRPFVPAPVAPVVPAAAEARPLPRAAAIPREAVKPVADVRPGRKGGRPRNATRKHPERQRCCGAYRPDHYVTCEGGS